MLLEEYRKNNFWTRINPQWSDNGDPLPSRPSIVTGDNDLAPNLVNIQTCKSQENNGNPTGGVFKWAGISNVQGVVSGAMSGLSAYVWGNSKSNPQEQCSPAEDMDESQEIKSD